MHIVQLRGLPRPVPLLRSRRIRAQQGGQAPQQPPINIDTEGMMIMEYLMRGTLHKALSRATQKQLDFPNRVLWHVFHCRMLPKPRLALAEF
jgi:hypothetical protein